MSRFIGDALQRVRKQLHSMELSVARKHVQMPSSLRLKFGDKSLQKTNFLITVYSMIEVYNR